MGDRVRCTRRLVALQSSFIAIAAALAVMALALAPRADAALLGGSKSTLPLSPLASALPGLPQGALPEIPPVVDLPAIPKLAPGEAITNLPIVGELPAVGEVGKLIDDLLDPDTGPLSILNTARTAAFTWRTTYRTPGGDDVVRTFQGVPYAPQPLDVDGNGTPDVIGQLEVSTDGTKVLLRVSRALTGAAKLPLAVEIVVDSTRSNGAGTRASFGYDTRESDAPSVYQATIGLTDGGSISVDSAIVSAAGSIVQRGEVDTLLAGGKVTDPKKASIRYAPVPASSHIGLLSSADQSGDKTSVELSASVPTKATIDADITSGAAQTVAHADVEGLPESLALQLDSARSGARTLAYKAAAPVPSLAISLQQLNKGALTQRIEGTLTGLPREISLVQQGARTLVDASEPIVLLDVAGSNGGDLRRLEDDQYAYLRNKGGESTFAVRLKGLKTAELDSGDALTLRATSAGGRFHFLQEGAKRTIDAFVEDLPAIVSLAFDPQTQKLAYDASAPVGLLAITARDPDGLQGSRATALDVTLRDLPQKLDISLGKDGAVGFDAAGGTLGSLEALLTSGPKLEIADGEDGVALEDLPDRFVAAARLTSLRHATVSAGDKPEVLLDSTAGRRFTLAVKQAAKDGDPVRRIDAAIDALKPNTRMGIEQGDAGPRLHLSSDEPTNAIDLEAENLPGLDGLDPRVKLLRAKLRGLPRSLDLGMTGNAGGGMGIDAGGETLGLLEVLLTSGPDEALPEGTDGFLLTDTPERYTVAGRVEQLRSISVAATPHPELGIDSTAGNPFLVELTQQKEADAPVQHIRADVDQLKPDTRVSYADGDGAPQLRFSSAEPTHRVQLEGENVISLAGRAKLVRVTLTDLPTVLDLSFAEKNGAVSIGAGDGVLGELDALVTSGPEATIPEGSDGVLFQDLEDRYVMAAHLTGLRKVSVAVGSEPGAKLDLAGGRPFVATVDQRDPEREGVVRHLEANVDKLQPNTEVGLRTVDGKPTLHFGADEPTGEVRVVARHLPVLADRAENADLTLRQVPTTLDLELSADNGKLALDTGGTPLGQLEASVYDDLGPVELDGDVDGVKLVSSPVRFAAFVRIAGLRKVGLALEPSPELELDTVAHRPFRADVETSDVAFQEPQVIHAAIDALEPHTKVGYTLENGAPKVSFSADEPTGAVDLNASNLAMLGSRARHLALKLRELPKQLDLGLDLSSSTMGIDAGGERLGLLEASLSSDGVDRSYDASTDGLLLEDTPDHYAVFARLTGLNKVLVSLAPTPRILLDLDGGRPFVAKLLQPGDAEGDAPKRLEASIPRLERNSDLQYVLTDDGPRFTFDAAARTQGLTVDAENIGGLSERAKNLHLRMDDIPQHLDISLAQAAGRFDISAGDDELGYLEVTLTDGLDVTLPASVDGLKLVNTKDHFALFGRVTKLRRVQVGIEPTPELELNTGTNRPFKAEVDNQPVVPPAAGHESDPPVYGPLETIRASVDALQPNTVVKYLNGDGGPMVQFRADQPTGAVDLTADGLPGLGERVKHIGLTLRSLPTALDLGLSSESGTVDIDARGQRLGFLEALLSDGSTYTLPSDRDGIALYDTPTRYTLFGRLTGLRKVAVTLQPTPDLTLQTDGGRPFDAELHQQEAGKPEQTITAQLRNLQQNTRIALSNVGGQKLIYSAAAPTSKLILSGQNLGLGRAEKVRLTLDTLPTALNLDLGGSGGSVSLDAGGQTIGSLDAVLTSGPEPSPAPAGEDGLVYVSSPTQYTIAARVTGLKKIVAITDPQPKLELDATGNKIFNANINTDGNPVVARLDRLQRNTTVELTTTPVTDGTKQVIKYRAGATTNSLTFNANGVNASITNPVPLSLDICQAPDKACGGSGRTSNGGSATVIADQDTTLNLTSSGFKVTNMRTKYLIYDAYVESAGTFGSGAKGHIYLDTNNNLINGDARVDQNGSIVQYVQINLRNVRATKRLGTFKPGFLGFGVVSDTKSGSITCGSGTDLYAQTNLLGLRIGLTDLLC